MKNILLLFILIFIFASCKGNGKLNDNLGNKEFKDGSLNKTTKLKNIYAEDTIFCELVDVVRFFDKPIEQEDVDKFKKLDIKFTGDTIIIDRAKAIFVKDEIDSKKYFGKGSLYVFFTDYLLDKFNVNVKVKVPYIELAYEDAAKNPFSYYFLMNPAVSTQDHLFLYTANDYVLAFKKQTSKINFRDTYNNLNKLSLPLKYSFEFVLDEPNFINISKEYQKLLDLENFDNYSAIKLPQISKKLKPILLSAYDDTGQSILYLYIFSEDYKFLDKLELYYSYDVDSGNIVTLYDIDDKYNIKITKIEHKGDIERIIERKDYKINNSGKFVEVKK